MIPAAEREAQATACLEAAEKYHAVLVALGTGLAGSQAEGMELYQQAVLNCHDAIQSRGFDGDGYHFYLRRAIRNLHYRTEKEQLRHVSLPFQEPRLLPEEAPAEWNDGNTMNTRLYKELQAVPPVEAEQVCLVEQIEEEMRARFEPADRIALRLHVAGYSCQKIAEMIGKKDQSWVNRRITRIKDYLRTTFQPAFDNLGE